MRERNEVKPEDFEQPMERQGIQNHPRKASTNAWLLLKNAQLRTTSYAWMKRTYHWRWDSLRTSSISCFAKAARDSLNEQLTWAANHAVNRLKSMTEKLTARVTADEMKLAELEKNTAKFLKQMKKQEEEEGKEELNSDEDLPDLNIIKYFYLNMARSANVNEVSYISSFKSGAELERRFQYQFNLSPSSTRRVKVPLPLIMYEHEYTGTEARDIVWRMKHSWMNEMNLTRF